MHIRFFRNFNIRYIILFFNVEANEKGAFNVNIFSTKPSHTHLLMPLLFFLVLDLDSHYFPIFCFTKQKKGVTQYQDAKINDVGCVPGLLFFLKSLLFFVSNDVAFLSFFFCCLRLGSILKFELGINKLEGRLIKKKAGAVTLFALWNICSNKIFQSHSKFNFFATQDLTVETVS